MFGRDSKVAMLQKVPLFRSLTRKHLVQIGRLADEFEVRTGYSLVIAGERGHQLFIIVEGQAVARVGRGRTVRLGPGEYFGGMSLVDTDPARPRSRPRQTCGCWRSAAASSGRS